MPLLNTFLDSIGLQLTLMKDVVRRYTEVQKVKKIYTTESNHYKIACDGDLFVICNMWISKKNLKQLAFVIAKEEIDLATINIDSLPMEGVQIIHKVDSHALSSISKLIERKKDGESNYFKLPFINKSYIPQLAEHKFYFALICEPADPSLKEEFKIVVDQVYLHDKDEMEAFKQTPHEYIMKKAITFEYETTLENNKINLLAPFSVACILVQTEKNVDNFECTIKHQNEVVRKYKLSTDDPNHEIFRTEDKNTFVIDPFDNMFQDNTAQLTSVIHMREGSYIELEGKHKISVTYILVDVLRYISGLVGLSFNAEIDLHPPIPEVQQPPPLPEINQPEREVEYDYEVPLDLPGRLDNHDEDDLELFRAWKLLPFYQRSFQDMQRKISNFVVKFTVSLYKSYSMITAINKPLDEENNTCVVSLETIPKGGYYYSCSKPKCNKTFDHLTYHKCICHNTKFYFACPNCKHKINYFPQLYRNASFLGFKYGTWKYLFTCMTVVGLVGCAVTFKSTFDVDKSSVA